MWYHFTLTVPAGTPEDTPVEKELELTYGVIKNIIIPWDRATNCLVKVRILRFRHQIFPINPDEPACGAGGVEGGEEHIELLEFPFTLVALGYAPDTLYDHDITILINVLPLEVAEPWRWQTQITPVEVPWLTSA
jgi:hypothetical protein